MFNIASVRVSMSAPLINLLVIQLILLPHRMALLLASERKGGSGRGWNLEGLRQAFTAVLEPLVRSPSPTERAGGIK